MPNVELPPLNTNSGILARMLIQEVRGPGFTSLYDAELSKKSMRVIKKEVENRLTKPNLFNASGPEFHPGFIH